MRRRKKDWNGAISLFGLALLLLYILQLEKVVAGPITDATSTTDKGYNSGYSETLNAEENQDQDIQSQIPLKQSGLSLGIQVDFGKAKYGDSDGNGFDNATILGYGVNVDWNFRRSWSLWTNLSKLNSYDALSVYPGYEILDPSVVGDEKGVLTNFICDAGIAYSLDNVGIFNQMQLGIGWLGYNFGAKEHGFKENRVYQGIEILLHANYRLNDRLTLLGDLTYAPALSVDDGVKGDVNNPGRTANTTYNGYFLGTKWGLQIALNEKMWLESGFSYQLLYGAGHENEDYRFLEHDYTRYGFYALFVTRFNFGSKASVKAQPKNQSSTTPPPTSKPIVVEAPKTLEPEIRYPVVTVTKITPDSGFVNTKVDLTIEGTGFGPDAKVVLKQGQEILTVTKLSVLSEEQIFCSLDLKDAAVGVYDVTVANQQGPAGIKPKVFTVKQPQQDIADDVGVTFSPRKGFNNGSILITLKGSAIVAGMNVKLMNSAGSVVPGEIVKNIPGEIGGFFNLKGQEEGFYDFNLIYPDGHTKKADGKFEIIALSEGNNQTRTLLQVYFDVGKAVISNDQINSIKKQLPTMLENPKIKIILGGYTDIRGSYQYNLTLSMRRAEAVKAILVANGIRLEQIDIYAYGKEKAQNSINENVLRNDRRVEITIYIEN